MSRLDGYIDSCTLRPVSEGAERSIGVPVKIHDHGFIYLVDYMGNDSAIAEMARTSYGRGTRRVNQDEGLIRYLMRHKHTSPFERGVMTFHIKMPIFVARQWIRHRTASLNEYSARYSELSNEFYFPCGCYVAKQSQSNNQGRVDEEFSDAEKITRLIKDSCQDSYEMYEYLLSTGLSRELARGVVPTNVYTEMYWQCNLHNIFHFLKLRMDRHAQREIRDYAEAMAVIVQAAFPVAWKAFDDYTLNMVSFSNREQDLLKRLLTSNIARIDLSEETWCRDGFSKRELEEFKSKIRALCPDFEESRPTLRDRASSFIRRLWS